MTGVQTCALPISTYGGTGMGYINAGGVLDRISIFPNATTWVSGTLYVTYE